MKDVAEIKHPDNVCFCFGDLGDLCQNRIATTQPQWPCLSLHVVSLSFITVPSVLQQRDSYPTGSRTMSAQMRPHECVCHLSWFWSQKGLNIVNEKEKRELCSVFHLKVLMWHLHNCPCSTEGLTNAPVSILRK